MDFDKAQAIYKQIIEEFQKQFVRGELGPGDRIPSLREYAQKARVNPNTVQRAYQEMERMQMVETVRGQGTFVRAGAEMIAEIREQMAERILTHFIEEMRSLGYRENEIMEILVQRQAELKEAGL